MNPNEVRFPKYTRWLKSLIPEWDTMKPEKQCRCYPTIEAAEAVYKEMQEEAIEKGRDPKEVSSPLELLKKAYDNAIENTQIDPLTGRNILNPRIYQNIMFNLRPKIKERV